MAIIRIWTWSLLCYCVINVLDTHLDLLLQEDEDPSLAPAASGGEIEFTATSNVPQGGFSF